MKHDRSETDFSDPWYADLLWSVAMEQFLMMSLHPINNLDNIVISPIYYTIASFGEPYHIDTFE